MVTCSARLVGLLVCVFVLVNGAPVKRDNFGIASAGTKQTEPKTMIALNTWGGPFAKATAETFATLKAGGSPLDAVEVGCQKCQDLSCDGTVGPFGSPDATGETTLDAIIMDGNTHDVGAVGCLRNVSNAIGVARAVMEHTSETILVGEKATEFAKMMGFQEQPLENKGTKKMQADWEANNCQPNSYRNLDGVATHCPPYSPPKHGTHEDLLLGGDEDRAISYLNHDTIGAMAMDAYGSIAAGTSSNGAIHKVPGRVGDAAIVGAGAYADSAVGAAVATGDGDIMMRFLPAFAAVNFMAQGLRPKQACEGALAPIIKKYPNFVGALLCLNADGDFAGAGYGWNFVFTYQNASMLQPQTVKVTPMDPANAKLSR